MKRKYLQLFIVLLLAFPGSILKAQFTGAYAVANWGTVAVNSDGTTNTAGAPANIIMTSGNNGSGMLGTNDFTISVPQTGQISFNWSYSTIDGPNYDYPQYVINNNAAVNLNGYNLAGNSAQSGTQTCINVTAGDVFRLRMTTSDNVFGAATVTITNFGFTTGNLTVTPQTASVCAGNTVAFTATGANSYTWTGGISNGVPFTPTASAIYTVTGGAGACISTNTAAVVFNPPVSINASTTNICTGSSLTLTAAAATTYTWDNGSTASSIVVSPTTTTNYTLSGVTPQGCNSSAAITITVATGLPTLSIVNASAAVCPGVSNTLTASGANLYSWSGGVTNGVSFIPSNTTTYTVTGTNPCGLSTATTAVTVHPLPPVTASASQPTVCSGVSVTVVGGGASTYTWSPSNISNGVAFFPTVTQSYSVIGTSALGCTASAVTSISVTTTPILAPIATPTRICVGETATITASGAASYSWSPGNQNTSAITVTPGTTSTYTLLKWNDNCFDTKTITVLVDPLPTVLAFASPSNICLYSTTTLQAGGGNSYTWSPQGGQGPNSFTTIVSPQVSTNYTVTAFDGSCTSTGTVDVIVNQNPTITVSASSSVICQGDPVNLTVSGASNYQWSNNLGTASSVTDYPSGPTLYTVSGTNASNCTAVVSQVVLVNPLPVITTTVIAPLVCEGGTSTLSASGAATYTWNAGTNNTGPVTVVNTNANTIYTVTGSYTTGCINTKTVMVSVFEPTFAVSSNTAVCFGGSVTLVASAANSYTWINGPQGPTYMVSPPAKTVYTVIATSNSGSVNCTSTNTVEVDIYLNPTVTAVPTRTSICRYESVDLNANGAVNYSWNNNMNGATITVSPFSTTNYTVTGTDQFGCKNTGTVQVRVQTCVGIDENVAGKTLSIYPNPNNGEFTIETESAIHLVLVNELGQLIRNFELNDQNQFRASVKDLAKGIYFISGQNAEQKVHQKIVVSH